MSYLQLLTVTPVELGMKDIVKLDAGQVVQVPLTELRLLLAPQLVPGLRPAEEDTYEGNCYEQGEH